MSLNIISFFTPLHIFFPSPILFKIYYKINISIRIQILEDVKEINFNLDLIVKTFDFQEMK